MLQQRGWHARAAGSGLRQRQKPSGSKVKKPGLYGRVWRKTLQKGIQEARVACQDEAEAQRQRGHAASAARQDGVDPRQPQGGQQAWACARMWQKRAGSEARKRGFSGRIWQKRSGNDKPRGKGYAAEP